jgi:nucleoside-diphosphate-sugar epimerase
MSIGSQSDPILVTGATGFTGGALARRLRSDGARVRVLARPDRRADALEAEGFEVVRGELTDAGAIDRAVAGSRLVYHIAALFRQQKDADHVFRAVNRDAVGVLLDAARRHGCERFVHCSTAGVHGAPKIVPTDESAPFHTEDIYQQTKLEGELLAQEAIRHGQPVSIFRPGAIYGPGDTRFVKLFRPIKRGSFHMFGPGTARFHLTYIDDLVDGILLCGSHPAALGETFFLAGPEIITIWEFVHAVADACGVRRPSRSLPLWPLLAAAAGIELACKPFPIDPPLHRRRCHFFYHDRGWIIDKARSRLGYAPRIGVAEGCRRTARWYADEGLIGPIESPAEPSGSPPAAGPDRAHNPA